MITFEGLGIDERLIQATTELGYVNPTAIQEPAREKQQHLVYPCYTL
jgi:superfamily II DNA/RNA helicase